LQTLKNYSIIYYKINKKILKEVIMAEYRLIFNDDKCMIVSDEELIDKILLEQDRFIEIDGKCYNKNYIKIIERIK